MVLRGFHEALGRRLLLRDEGYRTRIFSWSCAASTRPSDAGFCCVMKDTELVSFHGPARLPRSPRTPASPWSRPSRRHCRGDLGWPNRHGPESDGAATIVWSRSTMGSSTIQWLRSRTPRGQEKVRGTAARPSARGPRGRGVAAPLPEIPAADDLSSRSAVIYIIYNIYNIIIYIYREREREGEREHKPLQSARL